MNRLDEESLISDRYKVYARCRPHARRVDRDELWFFDAPECRSALDSQDLTSQRSRLAQRVEQAGCLKLGSFFRQWLMYTDGSEHLKRRSAVIRALREIVVEQTLPLPSFNLGFEFDVIDDFCEPFVWHVLPRLLGLSTEECAFWKPRVASLVALPGSENPTIELMHAAELCLQELEEFLKNKPCKLLGSLTKYLNQDDEALYLAINIIGDGIHPTIAGLASEIFLRSSPEGETGGQQFRFHQEPPFQFAARTAIQPLTIGGVAIATGQRVVSCLGAANRASPSELPMTFGHGRHACVGRAQAEQCIQYGIETFAVVTKCQAVPIEAPRWAKSIGYRMIEALRMRRPLP